MLHPDYSLSRKKTPSWVSLIDLVSAQAQPVPDAPRSLVTRNENIHINTGDPPTDRTIFTLLSLFCMTLLSFLLGEHPFTPDRACH